MKQNSCFDVVLGIDMETDIGSYTDHYDGVQLGTPKLLEVMAEQRAVATYFWTGHAAENNVAILKMVQDAGHEIGCHGLFHETLGDPLFPLPNNWPVCNFEVEGRIREATRIVSELSGQSPRSFRCPRLWGSNTVVQVLEKENAVQANRDLMGATNPANAAEGTIRKTFAESIERNSVHGSDSAENAAIEIAYFFSGIEIAA